MANPDGSVRSPRLRETVDSKVLGASKSETARKTSQRNWSPSIRCRKKEGTRGACRRQI
jgi:hypothetical protein